MPRDDAPTPERPSEAIRGHADREKRPPAWHRSEQAIMGDGQLGSDELDDHRAPEKVNPEGTADIPRPIDRPFGGD